MLPIGPLMIEHRVIERLIAVMEKQADRIKRKRLADIDFIDDCIDFLKTYADRCHHGKEEEILFKALKLKNLSEEHAVTLNKVIDDHNYAREVTAKLITAKNKYFNSTSDPDKQIFAFKIYEYLKDLIEFYPEHIKKEDKDFFLPCMDYFSDEEKNQMLGQFWEFDRKLIHEKYKKFI